MKSGLRPPSVKSTSYIGGNALNTVDNSSVNNNSNNNFDPKYISELLKKGAETVVSDLMKSSESNEKTDPTNQELKLNSQSVSSAGISSNSSNNSNTSSLELLPEFIELDQIGSNTSSQNNINNNNENETKKTNDIAVNKSVESGIVLPTSIGVIGKRSFITPPNTSLSNNIRPVNYTISSSSSSLNKPDQSLKVNKNATAAATTTNTTNIKNSSSQNNINNSGIVRNSIPTLSNASSTKSINSTRGGSGGSGSHGDKSKNHQPITPVSNINTTSGTNTTYKYKKSVIHPVTSVASTYKTSSQTNNATTTINNNNTSNKTSTRRVKQQSQQQYNQPKQYQHQRTAMTEPPSVQNCSLATSRTVSAASSISNLKSINHPSNDNNNNNSNTNKVKSQKQVSVESVYAALVKQDKLLTNHRYHSKSTTITPSLTTTTTSSTNTHANVNSKLILKNTSNGIYAKSTATTTATTSNRSLSGTSRSNPSTGRITSAVTSASGKRTPSLRGSNDSIPTVVGVAGGGGGGDTKLSVSRIPSVTELPGPSIAATMTTATTTTTSDIPKPIRGGRKSLTGRKINPANTTTSAMPVPVKPISAVRPTPHSLSNLPNNNNDSNVAPVKDDVDKQKSTDKPIQPINEKNESNKNSTIESDTLNNRKCLNEDNNLSSEKTPASAGVQIGSALWELFCHEHNLTASGKLVSDELKNEFNQLDNIECLFYEGKYSYTPRALMIDLEPSVIDEIRCGVYRQLWRSDCLISGKEDAANNYGRGNRTVGLHKLNDTSEAIRKLLEQTDSLLAFGMINSHSGGTGSGMTSLILDHIQDEYSKIFKFNTAIFPSSLYSQSTVDPYNSLLYTHSTTDTLDCSVLLDNYTLYERCTENLNKIIKPRFTEINQLLAQMISSVFLSHRFIYYGVLRTDVTELLTNLIPYPRIHYPSLFYTSQSTCYYYQKDFDIYELTKSLFQSNSKTIDYSCFNYPFISCAMLYRGISNSKPIYDTIKLIRTKNQHDKNIQFVDWCPKNFKIGINNYLPIKAATTVSCDSLSTSSHSKSVCMLASNLGIYEIFQRNQANFNKLYQRKCFLHWFISEGIEENEFIEARDSIDNLQQDYIDLLSNNWNIEQLFKTDSIGGSVEVKNTADVDKSNEKKAKITIIDGQKQNIIKPVVDYVKEQSKIMHDQTENMFSRDHHRTTVWNSGDTLMQHYNDERVLQPKNYCSGDMEPAELTNRIHFDKHASNEDTDYHSCKDMKPYSVSGMGDECKKIVPTDKYTVNLLINNIDSNLNKSNESIVCLGGRSSSGSTSSSSSPLMKSQNEELACLSENFVQTFHPYQQNDNDEGGSVQISGKQQYHELGQRSEQKYYCDFSGDHAQNPHHRHHHHHERRKHRQCGHLYRCEHSCHLNFSHSHGNNHKHRQHKHHHNCRQHHIPRDKHISSNPENQIYSDLSQNSSTNSQKTVSSSITSSCKCKHKRNAHKCSSNNSKDRANNPQATSVADVVENTKYTPLEVRHIKSSRKAVSETICSTLLLTQSSTNIASKQVDKSLNTLKDVESRLDLLKTNNIIIDYNNGSTFSGSHNNQVFFTSGSTSHTTAEAATMTVTGVTTVTSSNQNICDSQGNSTQSYCRRHRQNCHGNHHRRCKHQCNPCKYCSGSISRQVTTNSEADNQKCLTPHEESKANGQECYSQLYRPPYSQYKQEEHRLEFHNDNYFSRSYPRSDLSMSPMNNFSIYEVTISSSSQEDDDDDDNDNCERDFNNQTPILSSY
ncbi:unnamed protein product [Trichobilharzia szidati]|nr:unnamed protein product [Trichobilharzia szidati]